MSSFLSFFRDLLCHNEAMDRRKMMSRFLLNRYRGFPVIKINKGNSDTSD